GQQCGRAGRVDRPAIGVAHRQPWATPAGTGVGGRAGAVVGAELRDRHGAVAGLRLPFPLVTAVRLVGLALAGAAVTGTGLAARRGAGPGAAPVARTGAGTTLHHPGP